MYTPIVSRIKGLPQILGGAADAKPLAALTPEFPDCVRKERMSFFLFFFLSSRERLVLREEVSSCTQLVDRFTKGCSASFLP